MRVKVRKECGLVYNWMADACKCGIVVINMWLLPTVLTVDKSHSQILNIINIILPYSEPSLHSVLGSLSRVVYHAQNRSSSSGIRPSLFSRQISYLPWMQLTMRVEHLVELLTLLTLPPLSTDCVFPLPRGKYNFLEYQPTVSEVAILRGCNLLFLSHFLWFSMRHSIAVTKWWNVAKAKEKFETRKPANRVFSRKLLELQETSNTGIKYILQTENSTHRWTAIYETTPKWHMVYLGGQCSVR